MGDARRLRNPVHPYQDALQTVPDIGQVGQSEFLPEQVVNDVETFYADNEGQS